MKVRRVTVEWEDGSLACVDERMIQEMTRAAEGLEQLDRAIAAAKRLAGLRP